MKNFNKEEFDKVKYCKHCDNKFNEDYNNRKITLIEKVDKYKLQRIIDDFDNNNVNEEAQNNLKKYYENLNNNIEIKIILIQVDIILTNFHYKVCSMKFVQVLFIKIVQILIL